jgi:hypothetical protein
MHSTNPPFSKLYIIHGALLSRPVGKLVFMSEEFPCLGENLDSSILNPFIGLRLLKTKTKLRGLSPRANYTDRAAAARPSTDRISFAHAWMQE